MTLLLDDVSIGAAQDLERATATAQALVERFGLGAPGELLSSRVYPEGLPEGVLSDAARARMEASVEGVLKEQQTRAREILQKHRAELQALRDLLIKEKILDSESLAALKEA